MKFAPTMFQEEIMKEFEVRVTIVGEQMFAAKIFSQERKETEVDFRRMNETGVLKHEVFALPKEIRRKIKLMMIRLGLKFGCFDFAVEKITGRFVFFEVNPAGQWLWIEDLTKMPISEAVAELLANAWRKYP